MITRRVALRGACACLAVAACGRVRTAAPGGEDPDSGTSDSGRGNVDTGARDSGAPASESGGAGGCTGADTGGPVDGWVELPLGDYPTLSGVGGYAYVELPEELLHLIVAQPDVDCFVAIWRICTHGACETEWDDTTREAVCPCHG